MDDLRALIIGIIGAFIVLGIQRVYRKYQLKSINQDIEVLEMEKNHLEAMKASSVEMSRSAYKSVFIIFSLISVGELASSLIEIVVNDNKTISNIIALAVWSSVLGLSLKFTKRYHNLGNYERSIEQMEEKLHVLKEKAKKNSVK